MSEGFFWVTRSYFNHPIFASEPYSEREAFLWLISEAAWKPRRKRVHNATIELKRGQVAHSTRFLAAAWKWSESRVRRFLNKLKIDAMIEVASDAHATLITVCNYDKYQSKPTNGDATNGEDADALATHSRRKREPRNQGTRSSAVLAKARTAPPKKVSSTATTAKPEEPEPVEYFDPTGSAENQFYASKKRWVAAGVPFGQLINIGRENGGDFEELISIAERAKDARDPGAYVSAVLTNYKKANAQPPAPPPDLPPWVHEARVVYGYPVEREGKYWRMAGALFDDDKIQVGN
jgi:hypothetical protein